MTPATKTTRETQNIRVLRFWQRIRRPHGGRTTTPVENPWQLTLELALALVAAALFAAAWPDRYRTELWGIGGGAGWNSDPALRIYDYANFREPPEIPVIWSQGLTDSNLGISVLGLAIALQHLAIACLGFEMARFRAVTRLLMAVLWTFSAASQASGDMTDPEHPSPRGPWYLDGDRGYCRRVRGPGRTSCEVVRASFIVTVVLIIYYVIDLGVLCAWVLYERRESSAGRRGSIEGTLEEAWKVKMSLEGTPEDLESLAGWSEDDTVV